MRDHAAGAGSTSPTTRGSGGQWQGSKCGKGIGQSPGPRPFALEAERRFARGRGQAPRRVQKGVTQSLGFGGGQFTFEDQPLGEGDEVLGHADQLDPAGVVVEVGKRQVAQPGVFGTADAVFDARHGPGGELRDR